MSDHCKLHQQYDRNCVRCWSCKNAEEKAHSQRPCSALREPNRKYSVDWKNIETGEEGWTGILYPSIADAEWAAMNLSGQNPNLETRVETVESFL